MRDIVYPLSPGPLDYDELRYSLRCLESNTRAERVLFFGGRPDWLVTDLHRETHQPYDKWKNMRFQWRAILQRTDLSDPFWAMNDDFYVLRDVGDRIPLWHGGDYERWLADLGPRFRSSKYVQDGNFTIRVLRNMLGDDWPVTCWSLHTPILIFKDQMREALDLDAKHDQKLHLRTVYGNLAQRAGCALFAEQAPVHDVKGTAARLADQTFASSANSSWYTAPLGKTIRARYPKPSRWEKIA